MAVSLSELEKTLKNPTYVPKTEEEMLAQAQNRYAATYDAQRLAAQQAAERSDLALQQQRASLADSYARQMEDAQKQTARTLSSNDRYSMQRGMQRSSYNAQRLANIMLEGNEAVGDIARAQTAAEGNIDAQRAQNEAQLAALLAQYDTNEAAEIQAYLDDLRDKEYEREQAANQYANNIAMALYEYGQKAGSGGGGGGGSASKTSSAGTYGASSPAAGNQSSSGSGLLAALGGTSGSKKTVPNVQSAVNNISSGKSSKPSGLPATAFNSVVQKQREKLTTKK